MSSKFNIVVYGSLSASGKSGLAFFNYRVAKYLYDKNILNKVYCLKVKDKGHKLEIPAEKIHTAYSHFPTNMKLLFLKVLGKYIKYQDRYLSEKIFDKYISSVIDLIGVQVLFNLKPAVPITTQKAREVKLHTITLATVAHPEFIHDQIAKIEDMYHIKDNSSYTNTDRIKKLTQTFEASDVIIPQIGSRFICKTYTDRIDTQVYQLKNLGGIDTNTYLPKSKVIEIGQPIKFVSVARFNLKKGVPLLLDAWRKFKGSTPEAAELHLIGSIDKTTQKVIGTHFSDISSVYYHSFSREIHLELPKYDVFVASSVSDLLPRTIMEAMACGLPVIASEHCGAADLVEPEVSGFIYHPFDTKKLVSFFTWFAKHKDEIVKMGKNGRERIEKLGFQDFLAEILSFLEERNIPNVVND
ncbi:MAG: glycosyltransferase [Bacteroidota bacterium]